MFVKKGDTYLLLKRSPQKAIAPNYFHPAGGKVDTDEDPLQAAKRELLEEAGITVKNIKLAAVITELEPHVLGQNWLIFHFIGEYNSGHVQSTQEGEFVWLTEEDIISNKERLFPSVRISINDILDSNTGTIFATFKYRNQNDEELETKEYEACVV
ncbi:NUDIX domain-containing protein [candidate division WWE3 bacterium]|uniref:NUDIX domain-containing protein n=1 Tax=candidate division WWE3 bacterium TaxID=2053526 RepID=A0A955RWK6_UNCKA|nr:NUDIX domain-containing protein [candidate division WWE3 bacterium]